MNFFISDIAEFGYKAVSGKALKALMKKRKNKAFDKVFREKAAKIVQDRRSGKKPWADTASLGAIRDATAPEASSQQRELAERFLKTTKGLQKSPDAKVPLPPLVNKSAPPKKPPSKPTSIPKGQKSGLDVRNSMGGDGKTSTTGKVLVGGVLGLMGVGTATKGYKNIQEGKLARAERKRREKNLLR